MPCENFQEKCLKISILPDPLLLVWEGTGLSAASLCCALEGQSPSDHCLQTRVSVLCSVFTGVQEPWAGKHLPEVSQWSPRMDSIHLSHGSAFLSPGCLGSIMLAFPSGGHVKTNEVKVSLLYLWVVIATPSLQVLQGNAGRGYAGRGMQKCIHPMTCPVPQSSRCCSSQVDVGMAL